jgi:hypothetical protein
MEWMVQAGLTPLQVLRSATVNGAKTMGLAREIGTIEPQARGPRDPRPRTARRHRQHEPHPPRHEKRARLRARGFDAVDRAIAAIAAVSELHFKPTQGTGVQKRLFAFD